MLRVHEMSFVSSVNFSLNKNWGRGRGATTLFSHSGLWLWEEFFFLIFFFLPLGREWSRIPWALLLWGWQQAQPVQGSGMCWEGPTDKAGKP